jgi:hypothetical protein
MIFGILFLLNHDDECVDWVWRFVIYIVGDWKV